MKRVWPVIFWQFVRLTRQLKLSARDSVGIPPNRATKICFAGFVFTHSIETEYYILDLAGAVRNSDRHDAGPIVGDGHLHAGAIREHVQISGLTTRSLPKWELLYSKLLI